MVPPSILPWGRTVRLVPPQYTKVCARGLSRAYSLDAVGGGDANRSSPLPIRVAGGETAPRAARGRWHAVRSRPARRPPARPSRARWGRARARPPGGWVRAVAVAVAVAAAVAAAKPFRRRAGSALRPAQADRAARRPGWPAPVLPACRYGDAGACAAAIRELLGDAGRSSKPIIAHRRHRQPEGPSDAAPRKKFDRNFETLGAVIRIDLNKGAVSTAPAPRKPRLRGVRLAWSGL